MSAIRKKVLMTEFKRRICELDAESIAYYRRNPCIACEDLLGIQLVDSQRYILQQTWNSTYIVWCCCRNFGKSFLGAILMLLKAILYENQAIYIVSSVGDQSKQTFTKIEEIVRRIGKTSASIRSLKDIAEKETVKSPTNKTGFSHNPSGYIVEFYNGSAIYTLNSNPDANRSRRANLVFFDEAAFCSDELITVCEAFATQNSDFITDIDSNYNPDIETRKCPTQLVYASSQDGMDKLFYKHYKNFAKKMLAGDRDYFACDMICDTAIHPYMNGKPYKSLLTQEKVNSAIKANKPKAMREYYNEPTRDGGVSQIVKWGTIRRNETFYIPSLAWKPNQKIALALDPSRTGDNSIISAMSLYEDPDIGWCGDIVNCVNLIDIASKKKYKLDSNKQLEEIRNYLLKYNGESPDYENIDVLLIDQGSGGGGVSTFADNLLNDWTDKYGRTHRGLIDANHEIYTGYTTRYPNAIDKLRLISPRKYRTQMVEEFIELIDLGVIHFPYEYGGQDFLQVATVDEKTKEEIVKPYELNDDEKIALAQIDLMKDEITSIHKYQNAEKTTVTYAMAKDLENKKHDDRFYTILLLSHRLYELRRKNIVKTTVDTSNSHSLFVFKKPQIASFSK